MSDTVAVIVTVCPAVTDDGFTDTVVAVVSPGLKLVPLTETCCVLPATLRVLFVTVMPALRLPTDCGVKFTETSQTVPADSEVDEPHGFASPPFSWKLIVYVELVEKTRG